MELLSSSAVKTELVPRRSGAAAVSEESGGRSAIAFSVATGSGADEEHDRETAA